MNIQPADASEEQIASILELRRARAEALGPGLFGDFAWDILLQLYAARLGERSVRLSDLESLAPSSTLARWVAVLEERGLVSCGLDGLSPAEIRAELSPTGEARMSELFRILRHLHPIA